MSIIVKVTNVAFMRDIQICVITQVPAKQWFLICVYLFVKKECIMKNPFYPFSIEVSGYTCLKSLEEIYYKRNVEYYQKFKKLLMVCSILLAMVCIVVIVLSGGWMQSLFATLLGGALSSIVWLISVIITDDMNYRINQIDNVILQIDKLSVSLHTFNHYLVNGMTVKTIDSNNLIYRLCNLLQVVVDLQIIDNIESNGLKFKWVDKTDINAQEFEERSEQQILSNINDILKIYTLEQISNFVIYNEKYLDGQLKGLKDVLLKRKGYILCGKVPIPQDKAQSRLNKAKLFDKIFNRSIQKGTK